MFPLVFGGAQHAAFTRVQIEPNFNVEDVAGISGEPVALKVQLPENAPGQYSFVMFRNLPPDFTLSAGFGAKKNWAVSLPDVAGLTITAPRGYSGTFSLEVLLVKGIGSGHERRVMRASFQPPSDVPAVAAVPAERDTLPTAAPPDQATGTLPPLDPGDAKVEVPAPRAMTADDRAFMERGNIYLEQGDIASARLIYRQLAKKGLAEGALAMAHTYDPDVLARLPIRGLQPDVDEAKRWYKAAEALGNEQAARRLVILNRR